MLDNEGRTIFYMVLNKILLDYATFHCVRRSIH